MPKIAFIETTFQSAMLTMIARANAVIREYARQDFDLTLRQLYYHLVSRGVIPNNDREYKRLGEVISKGRLAGLIDWTAIMDRTRNLRQNAH